MTNSDLTKVSNIPQNHLFWNIPPVVFYFRDDDLDVHLLQADNVNIDIKERTT